MTSLPYVMPKLPALFWTCVERGKRWRCWDKDQKTVGVVRYAFDGWDAVVLTGKKWPDGERSVNWNHSIDNRHHHRTFWNARRAVEEAVRKGIV